MALYLYCGNTLLGCASTPECIAPMAKLNPRFLVNRADADGELLLAIPAAPEEALAAFACVGVKHLVDIHAAAMDTGGSITPALIFEEFHRCEFIVWLSRFL